MLNFGEKLRSYRVDKGLKQEELAKILGITQSAISHFEQGTRFPPKNVITKLSQFFEVSEEELTTGANLARIELLKTIEGLSPNEIEEMNNYAKYLKWRNSGENL